MSRRYKTQNIFPKHELVRVIFSDPTEFDTRFDNSDDPIECVTVGWLIELGRQRVKLAWLCNEEDENGSAGLILPKGCVKEITRLQL